MESNLKLPGSSFEEISKIIQAYAFANKAVTLEDVRKRTGMHETAISRNNGFLVSLGVLEGGRNKSITDLGKRLGDALSHQLNTEVTSILHQIVENTEFLKNIVSAVRIRRGMDESSLKSHIAYSAGQSKSQSAMTGTGAIIEMLRRSGHIEESDGKLVAAVAQPVHQDNQKNTISTIKAVPTDTTSANLPRIFHGASTANQVTLSIEVRIDCKPNEIDGLGSKLRNLITDFETTTKNLTDISERE